MSRVWDAVGQWGRCDVWRASSQFHAALTRNDKVVSIANLYSGQEVIEESGHYLIDAMSFYLLRDWSVKLLVPHLWFIAESERDDSVVLLHKAWPVHSGQRYEHTVKQGPPLLLIPKSDFKLCEARA